MFRVKARGRGVLVASLGPMAKTVIPTSITIYVATICVVVIPSLRVDAWCEVLDMIMAPSRFLQESRDSECRKFVPGAVEIRPLPLHSTIRCLRRVSLSAINQPYDFCKNQ